MTNSPRREYLLEWVSRFENLPYCRVCKIHNANLKSNQLKILLHVQLVRYPLTMIRLIALKTLRNLIESIRLRQNLLKNTENDKINTENKYAMLSTAVTDESEETVIVEEASSIHGLTAVKLARNA
ncbi:hypothetical protein CEXT_8091 [Caerostris extrusa]|uniref:Uncharacterized protein n=1 Tax=Caerostris extrusa TaxID=172846 RepID=A0AAV4QQ97_CAEEX|nr:hypothetical protein CEXT_8091 [Caerostris extrusa]